MKMDLSLVPYAAHFALLCCDDRNCNHMHLVALDFDGRPIIQGLVSNNHARKLIEALHRGLYRNAAAAPGDVVTVEMPPEKFAEWMRELAKR